MLLCPQSISASAVQVHFGGAYTDTFYIPAQYSVRLLLGLTVFSDHEVHHAFAVPAVLGLLAESASDYQVIQTATTQQCLRVARAAM